uniref:Annexin n=1 Tax=Plectus sambesii TaxID=2011161 RepID=A0A914XU62_9BILA
MPHQPATSGRGLGSSSRRREVTSKVKEQLERDDQSQYEKENVKQEGTLKPYRQFSAEADAELLRKAMKGLGTDEDAVISVFGNRTNKQRQEVIKMYKTMFGKDLVKDLKSELNGDMWKTIKALCLPPADYDATELRNAIQGLGTDDSTVIEIICTRTSKSIQMLKESYKKLFNKSLEDDIAGDTSGHFKRLLTSLLQANRDDNNVIDRTLAKKEAKLLFDSGAKKWGTDESRFNAILVSRSQTQLRATFEEYYRLSGKSIEDAIKSEMSGDMASGLLTMVRCIQNKPRYFALQLYKSMKGVSTDDDALIRIIVSRCEIDMVQVKEEFQREYKQALGQFVASDTSGDYRNLLLSLIGETTAAKAADSASKKRRDDNSD